MRLYFLLASFTGIRRKMASQQVRHLVFILMLCLLPAGLLLPSLVHAKAAAPAKTIQVSGLTMINQHFGWAVSANSPYHVYRTHSGPEHWSDVTPPLLASDPQTILTSSYFPDATRGYLGVLQNANVFLLSTQDGGKTWQTTPFAIPILTDPVTITQITYVDTQHGWLSFKRANFQPGDYDILLMSTNDGGKTWQTLFDTTQNPSVLPLPYGNSSHFLFTTPQNGWVTGIQLNGDAYLYATHDGGKTWKQPNIAPLKGSGSIDFSQDYGPYWQNSKTATLYVKYDTSSGNGMPHITTYQTYNGGASWILESSSPSSSFQELFSLNFLNAQQGWSFGFDGQGQFIVHHTNNGGRSWELISPTGLLKPDTQNQVIGNLSFLNARTGWVAIKDIQNNWNLFQSDDGGHTWNAIQPLLD